MTAPKRNLPFRADHQPAHVQGQVVDSIVVYEWSHGSLHLPGDYSTEHRPPAHHVEYTATNRDRCDIEPVQLGAPERYTQAYKVWNYNDSPAFADLVLESGEQAAPGQA